MGMHGTQWSPVNSHKNTQKFWANYVEIKVNGDEYKWRE